MGLRTEAPEVVADPAGSVTSRPLASLLAVDLGESIATAYLGRLLVDAGATVARVEPVEGTALRRRRWGTSSGADGPLFRYLDAGKRSVTAATDELLGAADVLLSDDGRAAALAAGYPDAIVVSYTPFGLDGPYADRPASGLVVQALSGSVAGRGAPDGVPVQAGGDLADWVAGAAGAAAVVTAWRCGAGTLIDLTALETAVTVFNGFQTVAHELTGVPSPVPARVVEVPSIERAADGWVGFCTLSAEQFRAFCELIGKPHWADDPEVSRIDWRAQHGDRIRPEIEQWTATRTVAEIVAEATAARVPCAPVGNGATLGSIDQLRMRGCLVEGADGLVQPAPAARMSAHPRAPRRGRPPRIAEHDPSAIAAERAGRVRPPAIGDWPLPLAGVRVFDMTSFWAGPAASQLLGAFGAEVIKVESIQRPDGTRLGTSYGIAGERLWERAPLFHGCNTSKAGITLDMTRPAGVELARRLLAECDVLIENYTPRVAERFGLLDHVRDDQIVVRMPAWGLEGPWRDRPGFAQSMEQATGLAWVTGQVDGRPLVPRGPCDPNGAFHAAMATVLALLDRDRTGRGQVVESALVDAALAIAAEQIVEFAADGTLVERSGNRDRHLAPQGVYAAAGQEEWIALTVRDETDWQALCDVLARPDLAVDHDLGDADGRRRRHDELDEIIGAWASARSAVDAAGQLAGAGIPATELVSPRDVGSDPHLMARGYFETVDHPVVGRVRLPSFPGRLGGREENYHRRPAPLLGGDGRRVLRELLGVDDASYARLERDGIVGEVPASADRR